MLPDVISEMLHFIKVPKLNQSRSNSRLTYGQSKKSDGKAMQVLVTEDDSEGVEACYGSMEEGATVALKKTKYSVESQNMRLVLVDLGSVDSYGSFVSSKPSAALTETIIMQGQMQANFEMTTDTASGMTVEKDYKVDAERVEIYTAQGADLLHPVQLLEPAKFSAFYYQNVGHNSNAHLTDIKFVTLSPVDLTISMQNMALMSTLASSISDSFADDDERDDKDVEFHSLSANDIRRIVRLDSALEKEDQSAHTLNPSEHESDVSIHSGSQIKNARRVIRMKMTSPETTLTMTNDFQGLDEALFKIVAMNCVFGGELDYPTGSSSKPCFGFNTNTRYVLDDEYGMITDAVHLLTIICRLGNSFLADYFDAASNQWEQLLTSPWELTFNASRGPQTQTQSHTKRMSTTFDIESNPCHVSFSGRLLDE